MKDKRYITQLTQQDMKELEQLTNMEPGWLIRIEKSQGKMQIGIDPNALAQAINGFFRYGRDSLINCRTFVIPRTSAAS